MRRLALVGAGLVLPLLPAAPAFATGAVLCVTGVAAGTSCDQTFGTIAEAIAYAGGDGVADTVLLGPVTYATAPLSLNGTSQALTLQGSGPGTVLAMSGTAGTDTFLFLSTATVQDLTVQMPPSPGGDLGVVATSSSVRGVSVDGTGTSLTTGLKITQSIVADTSVLMPLGNTIAVASRGGNTVSRVDLRGGQGYAYSSLVPDTLSRARIITNGTGVSVDSGQVNVDNTIINLGSSGATGLDAANYNNAPGSTTIDADHITIVGGAGGSQGVHAFVSGSAAQQSTINLANSIVEGPETSLVADASGSTTVGTTSHATINARYSDWSLGTMSNGATGIGNVAQVVGNVKVDPDFASAGTGDYHLAPGSLLVDLGDPAPGGPALDLDGLARVTDGDGDGSAIRDMGAYELGATLVPPPVVDSTAPQTTITAKPHKRLTKRRARFAFGSSEPGSAFRCKLDRQRWHACSSPTTYRVKLGKHLFRVRAIDAAGNSDPTPTAYTFKRVR